MICGVIAGAIAGVAIVGVNQLLHPDTVNLTLADYGKAALIGAAAGGLITSGIGLGAGTALGATLFGMGMGAAASAAGYTITAGSNYNSNEMMANAAIGGLAGAASGYIGAVGGSGLAAKILQAEISMGAGEAQLMVGDYFDDEDSTTRDMFGGMVVGGASYVLGEILSAVNPRWGPVVGQVIRSSLLEAGANKMLEGVDKMDNPDRRDQQRRRLYDQIMERYDK